MVSYHPRTSQVVKVELRDIFQGTQLIIEENSLWQASTFAELQEAQRTRGLVDPDRIAITDLTADERAAFIAALAE